MNISPKLNKFNIVFARINPKQIQDLQKMRERNNQYPTRQQDTGNFRRGNFN